MPSKKQFVHLHLHTEFSLLDGACRIDKLMDRLKEIGQESVAITDHGAMHGVVEFYKTAKAAGIKPIIGCEVYVATRSRFDKVSHVDASTHLVLLCKNETGYKNLIKMVSCGYTEGFYKRPRIDKELLEKYHEGLICMSACLAGEIPRALSAGDFDRAKKTALWYEELFGQDNFYIEIQDHGLQEQQRILPDLIRLAQETGIPLVASNDSHYLRKDDARIQQILMCIQTGKTLSDDDKMEFGTDEFYVKSAEQMHEVFKAVPESCDNTLKIAKMCEFDFDFGHTKLPAFTAPNNIDNDIYFRQLCEKGLESRYGSEPSDVIRKRLDYETSVITQMGYTTYYLIVADFIRYARSKGIPVGPGRGSGAGSIAAYCMGITGIDPIRYNLLFERFLNPERVSMPDFDIDFCYERRQEVIDYVVAKYGEDHVAQIITFGTMAARAAIRDVGRVLDIPYQKVDTVAKMVPMELKMTLQRALDVSKVLAEEYSRDPEVHELIDIAMKLEGMPRHASTHAAGVVITPRPAYEYVPLSTNDGAVVTQFPMGIIEELGLLKMDFLGLRTLTVISDAEKMIHEHTPDFSIDKIPDDDIAVYELLSAGDTDGVFQLESSGMRQTLVGLKPRNLEDIIALVSLYRPGPMESIPMYIRNRHNPAKVTYKTPQLAPIMDVTYGCIVYQEQVMQICQALAGYSYGQADLVRRAMSKKKHDVMEKERNRFIFGSDEVGQECPGCIRNGISESIANEIFNDMSSFASYAFNKSHAAAYAVVAYQTAYLKCYYAKEYMAALLTSMLAYTDKIIAYIAECQRLHIRVLPPDINESFRSFGVQDGAVRYGLLALKNVGSNLIDTLVNNRKENGPFKSLYDFCSRMAGTELNRRAIEGFIKSGAFDNIESNRHSMILAVDGIIKSIEGTRRKNLDGQLDLFGALANGPDESSKNEYQMPSCEEYPKEILLQQEKEVSGLFLSGHPLEKYRPLMDKKTSCTIADLVGEEGEHQDNKRVSLVCIINKVKFFNTKSGENMAFVTAEDLTGSIEIVVFPSILQDYLTEVKENTTVLINGRTSVREEEQPKILAEDFELADVALQKLSENKAINGTAGREGLYLRVPSMKGEIFGKIEKHLNNSKGEWPVYVRCEDTGKMLCLPSERWIAQNDELVQEMQNILGDKNVAVR